MIKEGVPARGTPGGHIGQYLTFAYCKNCKLEWVWIKAGVPNCMDNCGCEDFNVVVVNFKATYYGLLSDFA